MSVTALRKGAHVVFSIHLHITLVTKYRRKALTVSMLETVKEVATRVLRANQSVLIEFGGEPDHCHLLIDLHPDNNISDLVGSIKSATSRIVRKTYPSEVNKFYGKDKGFWHDGKCIISCGGAPLEVIKHYVASQSGGRDG
ncbi:IS200/IS605 family transposase [Nostoc sp. 'Peltigera malacea cyanobiont' DB3992]|uniref:IS200/IS605 family transposase n=1 Tax=Nostoc sp. 'Peltigera malacea cyanobiont' DB3992 TaxID=1206980 RepID=UPI000C040537|nr:IS200/IS605 family transposase [Nostoc sp. 'Peltigera malacea cyanobiont' DB3992]